MSRAFLRFICRGLRGIHGGYAKAPLTGDSIVYYTELCQSLDTSPVRTDIFEKLLAGVDSAVKHAYTGAGFGDNERPGPEKELLISSSRIPPVLITAASTILRQTVPAMKAEIDRMAIYLGDYSWLGFGADPPTQAYRRSRDVDIIKKIPIPPRPALMSGLLNGNAKESGNANGNSQLQLQHQHGHLTRRCVRCCEISEAAYPPRSVLAFRMIFKLGHLRSCVCGGMWNLESGVAS